MMRASIPEQHRGVIMILAATLFIAVADGIAKALAASYSTTQITLLRSTMGLILVGGWIVATARLRTLRTRQVRLHGLRALLIPMVMMGVFYALGAIPMVEVEAIGHSAPFFVALLAPLLVKERVSGHNWAAIAVGFAGVLIILRPDPARFHIAHVYMLFCAMGYAVMILLARRLTATDSIFAINFYTYPFTILLTATLLPGRWVTPPTADWILFGLFTLLATTAVFLFIAGIRHVDAALAATLDYFTLIWVALIGYLFWNETPDAITTAGILLIVASGIYIVRHSTRRIDESIVQTTDH